MSEPNGIPDLYHKTDGGRMCDTGKTCVIGSIELPLLRCVICGEEFDPSDFDDIGPGPT